MASQSSPRDVSASNTEAETVEMRISKLMRQVEIEESQLQLSIDEISERQQQIDKSHLINGTDNSRSINNGEDTGITHEPVVSSPEKGEVYFKESVGRITHQPSFLAGQARPLASIPFPWPAMGTNLNGRNDKSGGVVAPPVDATRRCFKPSCNVQS